MTISDVAWEPERVAWLYAGDRVERQFDEAIRSVCVIDDPLSIVVVESVNRGPANAIVFNPDGFERLRLRPPVVDRGIGFDQVFVSKAGPVAVFATRDGDLQGEPDLITGELRSVREWR